MATTELPRTDSPLADHPLDVPASDVADVMRLGLSVLASLKLTVVLFALLIFLIFTGTLAQVDHGSWDVV